MSSKLHSDILCILRAPTSSTIPQPVENIVDLPELLEAQFGKELATKERCRDSSGRLEVTMNYSETTVITIDSMN